MPDSFILIGYWRLSVLFVGFFFIFVNRAEIMISIYSPSKWRQLCSVHV